MRGFSLVVCVSIVPLLAACGNSTGAKTDAAPALPAAPKALTEKSTDEEKIANATSAAPSAIGSEAGVVEFAADGKMRVLRQGGNQFTCMADMPAMAGMKSQGPMCADGAAMEWMGAMMAHKDPAKGKVGFVYMLQGGNDASNTDPFATQPATGSDWIHTGPHVMVLGDENMNKAYPHGEKPDTSRPYVMFPDTPYAHVMIPVAG